MINIKYFSASWCGPCKVTKPIISELKNEVSGLTVDFIDVDENYEESLKYQIRSVPTIILERSGLEVDRIIGSHSKEFFLNKIKEFSN